MQSETAKAHHDDVMSNLYDLISSGKWLEARLFEKHHGLCGLEQTDVPVSQFQYVRDLDRELLAEEDQILTEKEEAIMLEMASDQKMRDQETEYMQASDDYLNFGTPLPITPTAEKQMKRPEKSGARRSKKSKVNSRLPSDITSEAVQRFYRALDCPRSLACWMLFKYNEHQQLAALEVDPNHYISSERFRDAYLATSLIKKSKFLETGLDKEKLALAKFNRFEELCRKTNQRFNAYHTHIDETTECGRLAFQMRRKIDSILGRFDPAEMFDNASWGPGVSTLVKGEETFGAKKFHYENGVTRDLYPLAADLFPVAYPGWSEHLRANADTLRFNPTIEVGNSVITVAKTSTIDRVIAIEPGLNLWFQLGIGRMIRTRLSKCGINLNDQSRNQRLAKQASVSDDLVTVDFSSASDSIAHRLVQYLFDHSERSRLWYDTMDVCRSRFGTFHGLFTVEWDKFSSMGNGFTFDLESLIFYVSALVCCEALGVDTSDVSVFGDDVIIPKEAYSLFCRLVEHLGFVINKSKSFASGYFRESCGVHYYNGVSCKPVYFCEKLDSLEQVFNTANTIRIRSHVFYGCDKRFRSLFYWMVKKTPKPYRHRVPALWNRTSEELEPFQGGFISNFDEACPTRLRGTEMLRFKRVATIGVSREVDYEGLLLAKLSTGVPGCFNPFYIDVTHLHVDDAARHIGGRLLAQSIEWARNLGKAATKATRNSCALRDRTRLAQKWATANQWYDLGPWI